MKGSDPNKFGDRLSDAAKARAAQLEKAKALRKLKHPSRSRKMRSFLDS